MKAATPVLTRSVAAGLAGWALLGLLIGGLSALLGIGGGVIMVPAFRLLGGFSALVSSATSLFAVVFTALFGAAKHLKAGTCNVPVGLTCGIAGACTSVLGARLAAVAPGWCIMAVAVCIMVFSAWKMWRGARPTAAADGASAAPAGPADSPEAAPAETAFTFRRGAAAAAVGLLAGVLGGFVGVGGGFIMVPLFCLWLGMDMKHAAGTSLLGVVCLAAPAAAVQLVAGNVKVPVALAVVVGSLPGTILGQRLGTRLPDGLLRRIFAGLLIIMAVFTVLNEVGVLG